MKRSLPRVPATMLLLALLSACQSTTEGPSETAPAVGSVLDGKALATSHGTIVFSTHVKPVLEAKCLPCHQHGVLDFFTLEDRTQAFAAGAAGPRILPGRPEKSLLLIHAHGQTPGVKAMPPVGERLTEDERRILTAWISQGAVWPRGAAGRLDRNAVHSR